MVANMPMPMVNTKKPNRKIAILVIRPPRGRGRQECRDGAIVRFKRISIQAQIEKKKPYQMIAQRLGRGFSSEQFLSRSAPWPLPAVSVT
ncbi:hypothetical protein [Pseudomonas sp. GL93]|uniref:hypothetical protein n=1 Tax=Pseudomonas sp. GL93 TaxID=2014741 RepID=UPI00140308A0|nr:hypothetical protein [Pseudomonas sp. GL93]